MSRKDDEIARLSRENDRLCKEIERAENRPYYYPTPTHLTAPYRPWESPWYSVHDAEDGSYTTTTDTSGIENK